jgi:hypothetical protein
VKVIAVNILTRIPMLRVTAKPRMGPVPKKYSTAAAIKVVTLESRIALNALWKPASMADRIRENMGKRKKSESLDELIHNSIMQTMARSINTVVAVVLALVALLVFGGVTIKGFITILLIGVIAGCYSSIFISSPLWYDYRRLRGESI